MQSPGSRKLAANDFFFTCRKVAWEDLTLECSASLSQTSTGVATTEASADEDEDANGVEYENEGSEDGTFMTTMRTTIDPE